jgi:CRISPR/Cas system-associated protein Csm6
MEKQNEQLLRKLPSVDTLLKDPGLENYIAEVGRKVVADSIRRAVDEVRELLISQTASEMDETTIRQKIIADTNAVLKQLQARIIEESLTQRA